MRGRKPELATDRNALKAIIMAPPWLSKHAKAEWRRVMPDLTKRRILTSADLGSLRELLHRYRASPRNGAPDCQGRSSCRCSRGRQGADRRERISGNRSGETTGGGLDGLCAREIVRAGRDAAA
jgi:hypothetical protein